MFQKRGNAEMTGILLGRRERRKRRAWLNSVVLNLSLQLAVSNLVLSHVCSIYCCSEVWFYGRCNPLDCPELKLSQKDLNTSIGDWTIIAWSKKLRAAELGIS